MISPPFARLDYPSLRQSVYLNQASLGLIGQPAVTAMHTFIENVARHSNLYMSDRDEVAYCRELLAKIGQLSGEQVITIPGTNYVAANVVRKTDSDRIIVHFVNYNTPLKNVRVNVNLDGVLKQIDNKRIKVLSPDGGAKVIEVLSVRGAKVEFVLPELDVYDVVVIN